MPLYTHHSDTGVGTSQESICSGSCAKTWLPLLSHTCTPTSSVSLSGALTVINDANGVQVEYQGIPLYTYVYDTRSDEPNGQAVQDWHVATPDEQRYGGPILPVPTPGAWCE